MLRTHTCGELRTDQLQQKATLCGWVHRSRNAGSLLWIELRDRYGRTQLVFEKGRTPEAAWQAAQQLGREEVVCASGTVVARNQANKKLPTGEIELQTTVLRRLSAAEVPPFLVEEETDGGELLRLQHRYLDLRRPQLQQNLKLRHKLCRSIRDFLDKEAFIEVETPLLIKSTPEGARDFLVPSRLHPGQHYALPQSPQIFKQLLMVAGMDRYYQLARCFRDEDHRADRQPEFTQLDCELSFVTQEDILQLFEALVCRIFYELKGYALPQPFPRLSYQEAMQQYGTDKPDLRYEMRLFRLKEGLDNSKFPLFSQSEAVCGLVISKGTKSCSRRQLDSYKELVCSPQLGAKGLSYIRVGDTNAHDSPLLKHFSQETLQRWTESAAASPGDMLLLVAGEKAKAMAATSQLRIKIAAAQQLYDPSQYKALWVTDFPLFELKEGALSAVHHPFTAPLPESEPLLRSDPLQARAQAYDLVINGIEIGGGSLRICNSELQSQVFFDTWPLRERDRAAVWLSS